MYQLAFLVAACDYTLLGEEIFAAGAYYSRNPVDLGALSGQDFARALAIGLITLGSVLTTMGNKTLSDLLK